MVVGGKLSGTLSWGKKSPYKPLDGQNPYERTTEILPKEEITNWSEAIKSIKISVTAGVWYV